MIRTNESVSLVPGFLVEDKPPLYMVAYSAPLPRLPPFSNKVGGESIIALLEGKLSPKL